MYSYSCCLLFHWLGKATELYIFILDIMIYLHCMPLVCGTARLILRTSRGVKAPNPNPLPPPPHHLTFTHQSLRISFPRHSTTSTTTRCPPPPPQPPLLNKNITQHCPLYYNNGDKYYKQRVQPYPRNPTDRVLVQTKTTKPQTQVDEAVCRLDQGWDPLV